MSKARAALQARPATSTVRSRRRRRVAGEGGASRENFVQAFLDALRDILRDETRLTA
jgi:hypothetical protein